MGMCVDILIQSTLWCKRIQGGGELGPLCALREFANGPAGTSDGYIAMAQARTVSCPLCTASMIYCQD